MPTYTAVKFLLAEESAEILRIALESHKRHLEELQNQEHSGVARFLYQGGISDTEFLLQKLAEAPTVEVEY